MNVVLVDNMVLPERGTFAELDVHPHLGLLALAAAAEADGHQVHIVDPKRALKRGELSYDATLYDRVAGQILSFGADVAGFTALGCSFIFARGVAARLKRLRSDLPILLGGPHATMLHREILERYPQFDVVVRHEADETFASVLYGLEGRRFERIPGMSWRASARLPRLCFTDGKPKVADLDTLPMTSYDHYPVRELGLDLLRIEAGRGCPFACTFCSTAGFFQRSFRLKSAERLVRELDRLHTLYGVSDFKLDHDMFTVNRRKVVEFCEAVKGRGYRWRASARVDCVDDELLATMAESGCVGLYFGIETGSVRMQHICQKRLDLTLVEPILEASARVGIETTASFITGYPEETESDQNDTLDMLGRCFRSGCLPQLHILAPEPGTPMFDLQRNTIAYDGYGGPFNATLIGDDDLRAVLEQPDIFSTYYFYPAEMPRKRYVFAVEMAQLLRRAGPILIQYLLRNYGGRLSVLAAELRRFAAGYRSEGAPDAATLEAFMREKFGPAHHITSLFRYALCATSRTEDQMRAPVCRTAFDPDADYELSPDVEILPDLHDCEFVIERIKSLNAGASVLDDREAGDVALCVITFAAGATTSYRIDSAAEPIIRLFERRRTCREVMTLLSDAVGVDRIYGDLLEEIAQAGIIVPSTRSRANTSADHTATV
jgi:radical SAM superfamily enzyme YgiQ (UPF0313 family)